MGDYKERIIQRLSEKLSYPINRRRLLFFAMPKCGSSSMYPLARNYGFEVHGHDARSEGFVELFERSDLDSRFVFTVLRDPIERVYSAWRYLSSGGGNPLDAEDARRFLLETEDFDSFVKRSFSMPDSDLLRQIHFRPMANWVIHPDGSHVLDVVFALDQIEMVAEQFIPAFLGVPRGRMSYGRVNRSKKQSSGEVPLSVESLDLLRGVYSEDIELYSEVCRK